MITGIDKVVYGVEDLDECTRFFRDWGLAAVAVEEGGGGARFETLDGGEVELRPAGDTALPAAFEPGSTVRRVVWGVDGEQSLDDLRTRLSAHVEVEEDGEGLPSCTDPVGLRLSFRVTRRREVDVAGAPINSADRIERVNQRSTFYDRARPLAIGHVVLFTPVLEESVRFYGETLGFSLSDYYRDFGYFFRCAPEGGHHDLFLQQTADRRCGLNHVAFTVRDIHEVFGGGLHIGRCGWRTQVGPGRHPVSSTYFWYVHNPAGALVEYYADEDYCTADWEPREWERNPEMFAEWAITGGIDGTTRRQVRTDG